MVDIEDVITGCELAYEINENKPDSIREAAERMLAQQPTPQAAILIRGIMDAASPRIYLNAAVMKIRFLTDTDNYVEERSA